MNRSALVKKKILDYNPKGGLAQTALFFLDLASVNHSSTKDHIERVALLTEATAIKLKKDAKAAFFAGILHDIGKVVLPASLFDGHNISPEEYAQVKKHAQDGFQALKKLHMFTALCAGLHHNLYQAGYGVRVEDFPPEWSPATIKKVLDISMIVSICDFAEAYTTRKTKILDGSGDAPTLSAMLENKYPNEHLTTAIVLELVANPKKLGWGKI